MILQNVMQAQNFSLRSQRTGAELNRLGGDVIRLILPRRCCTVKRFWWVCTIRIIYTVDLEALSLRSLSRMAIQSRYPVDATPPSELFDSDETDQAIATASEVLSILKALDQQG